MCYQEFQQTCMARIVNLGKGARGGGGLHCKQYVFGFELLKKYINVFVIYVKQFLPLRLKMRDYSF